MRIRNRTRAAFLQQSHKVNIGLVRRKRQFKKVQDVATVLGPIQRVPIWLAKDFGVTIHTSYMHHIILSMCRFLAETLSLHWKSCLKLWLINVPLLMWRCCLMSAHGDMGLIPKHSYDKTCDFITPNLDHYIAWMTCRSQCSTSIVS